MIPMVNFLRCMGMILPLALMALGADSATGKWELEPAGRQIGTSRPTIRPDLLDLKADGATLTGSMTHQGFIGTPGATPPPPVVTPISRGKVDGSHIYFELTRKLGGYSVTTKYEGTVSGDKIDLNLTVNMTVPVNQSKEPKVIHVVAKRM